MTFDSEFECGNLLRAVQRSDASYDLFLRSGEERPDSEMRSVCPLFSTAFRDV